LGGGSAAHAQLAILGSFNPAFGTPVSCAFDPSSDRVWTSGAFDGALRIFSRAGAADPVLARPGEPADDFDISIAPEPVNIGGTIVPMGTVLVFNGETGVCEIYAVNKANGAVLASVTTAFGESHTVGGTYHAGRNTIFLVEDRNAATPALKSAIAEINPVTGAVINTFPAGDANWTVNYGDVEAHPATGNLWVVSSDETTVRELTPTGALVSERALPAGLALSGIGFDAVRGEAWVSNTSTGALVRLGGVNAPLCLGDVNGDGFVNVADFNLLAFNFATTTGAVWAMGDMNFDGAVTTADFNILASSFGTACD